MSGTFLLSLYPLLFGMVFAAVVFVLIFTVVKGIGQWDQNNKSPVLTVQATVVTKRASVSHHSHHNAGTGTGMHTTSSTSYYVTFQVKSGDRMELHVPVYEYGILVEGDVGSLTFQGTRYLKFERSR